MRTQAVRGIDICWAPLSAQDKLLLRVLTPAVMYAQLLLVMGLEWIVRKVQRLHGHLLSDRVTTPLADMVLTRTVVPSTPHARDGVSLDIFGNISIYLLLHLFGYV